jgi:hypothetical protein
MLQTLGDERRKTAASSSTRKISFDDILIGAMTNFMRYRCEKL